MRPGLMYVLDYRSEYIKYERKPLAVIRISEKDDHTNTDIPGSHIKNIPKIVIKIPRGNGCSRIFF